MSPFSRRRFLSGSLRVGAGAAALGLTGGLAEAVGPALLGGADAWASPGTVTPPRVPANVQHFVSRTDLTPPGVTISKVAGLAAMPAQPQYIFIAPRVTPASGLPSGAQGLMILDLDGNLVWYRQMTATGQDPFNFRVQTYKGKPALTWYQGTVGPGYGVHGTCIISDDTYTSIADTKAQNLGTDLHEFLITPEDTALITAYYYNKGVGLTIGHAQEVDIAGNELIFDWGSYPDVPASASYATDTSDYFHINSIDLWPGTRDYLISSRNTCAVYLISAQTKEILWKLGGTDPTFPVSGSTQFTFQHDARPLADGSGLSLFDDASQPGSAEHQSWGKVYTLDQSTNTATLRHEFNHSTSRIDTASQGNNQLLPTGGHLVGWGAAPYFTEYAPSGAAIHPDLVLDGRLPAGIQNYRAFMFDWTGNPVLRELALVVNSGGSGAFTAYASWNGATEVASWEVAAGTSSSSLQTVATVPKAGFETKIPFTYTGATAFELTALSSSKAVLGRTSVVAAS
jgi:hypothetical protein